MRLRLLAITALLTLPLAAQDESAARWRIALGLGAGTLDYDTDGAFGDSGSAGAFRLGFEGTSRRGFGGGLRLESFAATDLRPGIGGDDYDVGFGSLFGHFTYRLKQQRFAMPIRLGPLVNVLTLDNTSSAASDEVTTTTLGLLAEVAPEFTIARGANSSWTLYGEFGLGAGDTVVEDEVNDEAWDSSSSLSGFELGSRVYLGVCELSLAYVGRWQSMDRTDPGDLGSVDPDGYVSLHGRTGDRIVRGGENVYPIEVEAVLAGHPLVREVAVVGVPDRRLGDLIRAVVVPVDAGRPPDLGSLRALARDRLAAFKAPDELRLVDELPRNASGKVVRRALLGS